MQLQIEYTNNVLNKEFGNWLIEIMSKEILSSINKKKLISLDKYIEENFTHLYKKPVSSMDIIQQGLNEMYCDDSSSKLIIQISKNKFVPGMDRVRIESACKLINYGNKSVPGYPIFTNEFTHIANNISMYVDKYFTRSS